VKKGIKRGWVRRSRQKRLVYHSFGGGQIFAYGTSPGGSDGSTTGADLTVRLSRPLFNWEHDASDERYPAVPADGSIRGVSLSIIARNTTNVQQDTLYVFDYDDDTNVIGGVASGRGYGVYFGKVAGHYDTLSVPLVRTDTAGRFKYAVTWTAGTVAYYIRITGYWTEEVA
jgi:hypothetical protein